MQIVTSGFLRKKDVISNPRRRSTAENPASLLASWPQTLAAAGGVGAWTLPFGTTFFLIAPALVLAATVWLAARNETSRWLLLFVSTVTILGLASIASPALATALVGSALIAASSTRAGLAVPICIVALQFSYVPTIEAFVSEYVSQWGLEGASPAVIAASALGIISPFTWHWPLGMSGAVAGAYFSRFFGPPPDAEMFSSSIPVICAAALLQTNLLSAGLYRAAMLCAILAGTWTIAPPRFSLPNEVNVVLPAGREVPEARHYVGLTEALRFVGLKANEPVTLKQIPLKAIVLVPWLTTPLSLWCDRTCQRKKNRR